MNGDGTAGVDTRDPAEVVAEARTLIGAAVFGGGYLLGCLASGLQLGTSCIEHIVSVVFYLVGAVVIAGIGAGLLRKHLLGPLVLLFGLGNWLFVTGSPTIALVGAAIFAADWTITAIARYAVQRKRNRPPGDTTGMSGIVRLAFILTGVGIAVAGLLLPGIYSVDYAPPAEVGYPAVNDPRLTGFVGVFNAFSGPFSFRQMVWPMVILTVVGLTAPLIPDQRFTQMKDAIGRITTMIAHKSIGVGSAISCILLFMWQYRYGQSPQAVRTVFENRIGTGIGHDASYFVSGNLGAATLVVLLGLLVAMLGILPKIGRWIAATSGGLLVLLCVLGGAGVRIPYVLNYDYGYKTKPQALMSHCVLEHGFVDDCSSPDPVVTVYLPLSSPNARTGCTSKLIADWGDGTSAQASSFKGTAQSTHATLTHTYAKPGSYKAKQTEQADRAACGLGNASFSITVQTRSSTAP